MTIVVDASAVGAFLIPDELDAEAAFARECCRTNTVTVPSIFRSEVASILTKAARRQRITVDELQPIIATAQRLCDSFVTADDADISRIVALASKSGLSAYDASYAELAQRLGAPLLTRDGSLRRAATDLGIKLLRP